MAVDAHSLLLIDDNRALCTLMTEFFSAHDFRLTAAHDGPTGLRKALKGKHDLILLDWMLPSPQGYRSSQAPAAYQFDPHHPVNRPDVANGPDCRTGCRG